MQCPFCAQQMIADRVGEVEVERCAGCATVYLQARELATVSGGDAEMERRLRVNAGPRVRCRVCGEAGVDEHCGRPVRSRCPKCSAVLSVVSAAQVEVDMCFGCGGFVVEGRHLAVTLQETALAAPDRPEPGVPVLHFDPSASDQLVARSRADRLARILLLGAGGL